MKTASGPAVEAEKSRPHQVGDVWYRYDDYRQAYVDDYDDVRMGPVQLRLHTFIVQKVTAKGVWLCPHSNVFGDSVAGLPRHFVREGEGKRKAYPSKELALKSLILRKTAQARIYQSRLSTAKDACGLAQYQLRLLSEEQGELATEALPAFA